MPDRHATPVGRPVAVITGASSGIGRATARAFAAAGARLALSARRYDRLEALLPELTAAGAHDVAIFQCDVRDPVQVDAFVQRIVDAFGRIDILVNNAGLARGMEHLDDETPEAWDAWNEMLDTNVKGLLAVTRRVVPIMQAQHGGHVINMTSTASHVIYEGGGVYSASKHAALAINDTLRVEVAEHGIRVTGISPGLVETEFSVVRFRGDQQRADNVYANMTPLTPEDIAECILFAANRPPHVNIDEIILKPLDQASVHKVIRHPPAPQP
jgi:3-hydroxy acid dehydrogenase / malonic semialdehyde reductase